MVAVQRLDDCFASLSGRNWFMSEAWIRYLHAFK